jgi:hypothetical protein
VSYVLLVAVFLLVVLLAYSNIKSDVEGARMLRLALIRLAILDARDAVRTFRSTGETRRYSSPLPQRRHVRTYQTAYNRATRSYT